MVGRGAPTRPEVTVRVVGGTLTLRTPDQRPSGEFHNLEATVQVPAARSEPVAVELSADAPGQLRAEIRTGESGRARLVANGVALESLSILIRRFEPDLDLAGSFSADVTAAWDKQALSVEGTLGGKNIAASGPWLNGDRLQFATAELPLKLKYRGAKASSGARSPHLRPGNDLGNWQHRLRRAAGSCSGTVLV